MFKNLAFCCPSKADTGELLKFGYRYFKFALIRILVDCAPTRSVVAPFEVVFLLFFELSSLSDCGAKLSVKFEGPSFSGRGMLDSCFLSVPRRPTREHAI